MLDPKAAKGFIPGIVQAAELASKNILKASQNPNINLNQFLNYCSFDMFSSFMLGEMARSTESAVSIDQDHNENAIFCKSAVSLMETSSSLQRTPYEYIMNKVGIQTTGTKKAQELWNTVHRIGKAKYERFEEKYNRSDLNELEKASYYAGALTRWHNEQAASSNSISKGEIMDLCIFALFAGVDTTSNVLAWNLMHLALNPGVQEKLYKELSINTASSDGRITQQTLERSTSPYLHAFIRETNRITPPFPDPLMKRNSQKEVEVHGITFPKNTVFFLGYIGNDPNYVEDAMRFMPERWFPDAVNERKNTKNEEILDHPLMRDNFGQGARRCPGSRVATNEVLKMLAQLTLDYEISPPPHVKTLADVQHVAKPLVTPLLPQLNFKPRT